MKKINRATIAINDGSTHRALLAMPLENKLTLVGMEAAGPFTIELFTEHQASLIIALDGVTRVAKDLQAGAHSFAIDDAGAPFLFAQAEVGAHQEGAKAAVKEESFIPADVASLLHDEPLPDQEQPFLSRGSGRLAVNLSYYVLDHGTTVKRCPVQSEENVFQLNLLEDHLLAIADNVHRIDPTVDPADQELPGLWNDVRFPKSDLFG